MAKRGQRAKPTKLLELHGTRREDRHAGEEPSVSHPIGPAPGHLPPLAVEFWERVAGWLSDMGIGQQCDEYALEHAAMLYWRLRIANDQLLALGNAVEHGKNGTKRHAAATEASSAGKELRAFFNEMGLNPSARAALRRPTDKQAAEDERLFGTG